MCVENSFNLIKLLCDNSVILDIKFRQEPRFSFNQWRINQLYVRESGMKVAQCKQGFKYLNKYGVIEEKKSQAKFLYADDVCLMASNEQHLQTLFDSISGCIEEYEH